MWSHLSGDVNSNKAGLYMALVFADHKVSSKRCCKFEDAQHYGGVKKMHKLPYEVKNAQILSRRMPHECI